MESLIDEAAVRAYAQDAFEFHLIRRPRQETRLRLPDDQDVSALPPLALLELYWRSRHVDEEEITSLRALARTILEDDDTDGTSS
jgi:hypothetical protein